MPDMFSGMSGLLFPVLLISFKSDMLSFAKKQEGCEAHITAILIIFAKYGLGRCLRRRKVGDSITKKHRLWKRS